MEQEVMQAIRAELESNIDAKYREFHSSLVPGQNCRILSVRIPVSRRIAKATARDHYEVYTEQFNPEVYEELLIRGMMIGYGKLTREEQTAELDRFVPMINSWGICDSSCATCHFMKKDQEYWYGYLQKWLKSSREYEIRFGVVCLLDFFINEAYIDAVLEEMKKKQEDYCVEIVSAGIKDIILPGEIREIMNTVLLAEKRAQANVITRREEVASTRSLLNTARLMDENQTLFKLKEMEYLERICDKVGTISINGGKGVMEQLAELVGMERKEAGR